MNAALSTAGTLSHEIGALCNPVSQSPARAAALRGRVHNARVGSFFKSCSGGNIATLAVVVIIAAASVSLFGCAPVYAKGAPLFTPDLVTSRH